MSKFTKILTSKKFFHTPPCWVTKKYFGVILFRKKTISQIDLLLGKITNNISNHLHLLRIFCLSQIDLSKMQQASKCAVTYTQHTSQS